jgi:hypothetical protein
MTGIVIVFDSATVAEERLDVVRLDRKCPMVSLLSFNEGWF